MAYAAIPPAWEPGLLEVTGGLGAERDSSPPPDNGEGWKALAVGLAAAFVSVGLLFILYNWIVKDCLLTWKSKRLRRSEEIGFGNTPARGGETVSGGNNVLR